MIRILPGSSPRSVQTRRPQIAFARGACGGPVTIRRPQDPKTASNCPVNWLPRGHLARFAFPPGGNDGEHLLQDTSQAAGRVKPTAPATGSAHVLCPLCWLNRIAPAPEASGGSSPTEPPEQA